MVFLDLSFDGSHFEGWDNLLSKRTVSVVISDAIEKVTRTKANLSPLVQLIPSCHAVHFFIVWDNEPSLSDNFLHKINRCLPHDLALRNFYFADSCTTPHWRFFYEYHFHFIKQPFLEKRSLFCLPSKIELSNERKVFSIENNDIAIKTNKNHGTSQINGEQLSPEKALQIISTTINFSETLPAYGLYIMKMEHPNLSITDQTNISICIPEPHWFHQ